MCGSASKLHRDYDWEMKTGGVRSNSALTHSRYRFVAFGLATGIDYCYWLHSVVGCDARGKVILFAEPAVDAPGDLRGGGTNHLSRAAAEQNGQRDFRMSFIGIGDEPAHFRRWVVAGTGLAERGFVAADVKAALGSAIEDGSEHAFANFRQHRSNVQIALHARSESLNLVGSAWILQVVQRAAVGEGSRQRNQLQRRDLNSFTEAGHASHATMHRGRHRKCS